MLSRGQQNSVFDTIEHVSHLTALAQISLTLADAMEQFGFHALGINGLPPPGPGADPFVLTEKTPEGFRDFYIREQLYRLDHICLYAKAVFEPFRFSDAPYDSKESRGNMRFMQALATFGMDKGLIVPIGRVASMPACVWLAGESPDLDHDSILATQLVALFAASKALEISRPPELNSQTSRLSQREREVLQWTAAGKTSWEISVIMKLSERAINKIMADAMFKLEAVTRSQAVVNAIRIGEIDL